MGALALIKQECWLPEQAIFNLGCAIKSTQIPTVIDLVPINFKYTETVETKETWDTSESKVQNTSKTRD